MFSGERCCIIYPIVFTVNLKEKIMSWNWRKVGTKGMILGIIPAVLFLKEESFENGKFLNSRLFID